jgi:hypothetical protein
MSSTLQAAMVFPIAFIFSVGLISAAPAMYAETADIAMLRYEYTCEQNLNVKIYSTGSIRVNSASSNTVYTSPERMQCLIQSVRDSIELLTEGVKSIC